MSRLMRSSAAVAIAASVLAGCATPANNYDPLESVNRPIFKFNQTADRYALKPVAKAYTYVTPGFVQSGVHNFFENIDDVFTAGNGLLQGKFKQAGSDTLRFVVNTTIGIAGLFDVASHMGLDKHDEDLGQTLGRWGLGSGPYLMVPLLGPTTLRDSSNYALSYYASPIDAFDEVRVRNSLRALNVTDTRVGLFDLDPLLEDAFDPYTFMRDAYLQRRYNLVWDGKPPTPLKLSTSEEEGLDADPLAPDAVPGGEGGTDPLAPTPAEPEGGAAPAEKDPLAL